MARKPKGPTMGIGATRELYSRRWLIEAIADGLEPEYLLFWGHTPPAGGGIGKHVLSQWWPARFLLDGQSYLSAEHCMMAEKARLFGDAETRARILAAATPAEAKALGRKVRGFDEQVWERERFEIVRTASYEKFSQNADLCGYLLGTGQAVLVEASPVDRIWGIGLPPDDPRATRPGEWQGLNELGFALMQARHLLRDRHRQGGQSQRATNTAVPPE
jgi:ribA/ribD-fused uncharacterized protein